MPTPKQVKKLISRHGPPVIGEVVQGWVGFELTTTYGIPEDVIEEILEIKNATMDWDDYHRRMEDFRNLSRERSKPMGLSSFGKSADSPPPPGVKPQNT